MSTNLNQLLGHARCEDGDHSADLHEEQPAELAWTAAAIAVVMKLTKGRENLDVVEDVVGEVHVEHVVDMLP